MEEDRMAEEKRIMEDSDSGSCCDTDSEPGDDELRGDDKHMLVEDINDAIT